MCVSVSIYLSTVRREKGTETRNGEEEERGKTEAKKKGKNGR